jgi:outer membrane murein-binding lipoprotein Lpp
MLAFLKPPSRKRTVQRLQAEVQRLQNEVQRLTAELEAAKAEAGEEPDTAPSIVR